MTAEDRAAWTLWQIRAIWRAVIELTHRVEALEENPHGSADVRSQGQRDR